MIIANSALRSSLAIYNLHARSWNNCLLFYNDVPTFIAYCGVKWSRLLIYQGSPEYCDQRKLTGKVLSMKLLLIVLTYRLKLSWEKIDFKKNSPFQDSTFYIRYHFLSEIENKNKWINERMHRWLSESLTERELNPLTPKISLVILLTVCQTILVMLVGRMWYRTISNPIVDIFLYSHHLFAW